MSDDTSAPAYRQLLALVLQWLGYMTAIVGGLFFLLSLGHPPSMLLYGGVLVGGLVMALVGLTLDGQPVKHFRCPACGFSLACPQ